MRRGFHVRREARGGAQRLGAPLSILGVMAHTHVTIGSDDRAMADPRQAVRTPQVMAPGHSGQNTAPDAACDGESSSGAACSRQKGVAHSSFNTSMNISGPRTIACISVHE